MNTTLPVNHPIRVAELVILIILIIITVSTNIALIICISLVRRLRNMTNIYICSLAVSDLLVGIIVMPFMALYSIHGEWPLGWVLCSLWEAIDFACCTVSMLHLCLLAYERYHAVVHPLRHMTKPSGGKRAGAILLSIWTLGILAWAPAVFVYSEPSDHFGETQCLYLPNAAFVLAQSITVYYIPVSIMIYFYTRVMYTLRKGVCVDGNELEDENCNRKRSMSAQWQRLLQKATDSATETNNAERGRKLSSSERRSSSSTSQCRNKHASFSYAETSGVKSGDSRNACDSSAVMYSHELKSLRRRQIKLRQRRRHRRCARTLGAIMAAFIVCWMPFFIFWPMMAHCKSCISQTIYELSYWATYLNSTVNPILCFLVNRDFRHGLRQMFGLTPRRRPSLNIFELDRLQGLSNTRDQGRARDGYL